MLPTQTQLLLPLVAAMSDAGGTMRAKSAADEIASHLGISPEERVKNATTPGGKRYNILDHTVRWAHQLSKLRGLIANAEDGVWTLTENAQHKLHNIRPGHAITVFENDHGIVLWATAEAVEQRLDNHSVNTIVTSPPYELTRPKSYAAGRSESEHIRWLYERADSRKRILTPDGSLMLNLGLVFPELPGKLAQRSSESYWFGSGLCLRGPPINPHEMAWPGFQRRQRACVLCRRDAWRSGFPRACWRLPVRGSNRNYRRQIVGDLFRPLAW